MQAPHTPEGQEIHEQTALDALRINKTSARDLISKTLPLPEAVIQAHQKILLELGKEFRDKRFKVSMDPIAGERPTEGLPKAEVNLLSHAIESEQQ